MVQQLKCPTCQQSIYFTEFDNNREQLLLSLCTRCNYKYELLNVSIIQLTSSLNIVTSSKITNQTRYKRSYQLRVLKVNDTQEVLCFTMSNLAEKIIALPGETILLLHLVQSSTVRKLILIKNSLTDKTYLINLPDSEAKVTGFKTAMVAFTGGLLLGTITQLPLEKILFPIAIPSIGLGACVYKQKKPKTKNKKDLARLGMSHQLLERQFQLTQRLNQLNSEFHIYQQTLERLTQLKQKMLAQRGLYEEQVKIIDRGINIVRGQLETTQKLIDGYAQLNESLAIEYETIQLIDKLPENFIDNSLTQLQELEMLELKKSELAALNDLFVSDDVKFFPFSYKL